MEGKNIEKFTGLLVKHPEGVSHSELRNWWPGGGKCRPKADELKQIAEHLYGNNTIQITEVASPRGRPATIYQLSQHAAVQGIKTVGSPQRFEEKLFTTLRDYLIGTGRTYRQLTRKFGADVNNYLHFTDDWAGFNLFKDVNKDGEHSFILLPKPTKRLQIEEKDWTYHVPDLDGKRIPYQMVQLPDAAFQEGGRYGKYIRIVPIFDVHYGNSGHRAGKFAKYIQWIKDTPGMYAILGGDIMENALDDGRGMCYDQIINPQNQLDQMAEILAPIAHRILCSFPGNHEWRTYKKAGIDPAKLLADRLEVPYHAGPVLLNILAGGNKYRLHAQHGFTRPATKGGQLNNAMKPMKWIDADIYLSGHTHEAIVSEDTVIRENAEDGSIAFKPRWVVITQSFMGWLDTYGYRAGYGPVTGGGVVLEMYENGEFLPSTR